MLASEIFSGWYLLFKLHLAQMAGKEIDNYCFIVPR